MRISLEGRRAFITAGAAGMGRATCLALLTSGFGRHLSGQIIGLDGHTETLYPRLPGKEASHAE